MNDLAEVVEAIYGPRCARREPGCMCCVAWLQFDCLDHLTDGTIVDLATTDAGAGCASGQPKAQPRA